MRADIKAPCWIVYPWQPDCIFHLKCEAELQCRNATAKFGLQRFPTRVDNLDFICKWWWNVYHFAHFAHSHERLACYSGMQWTIETQLYICISQNYFCGFRMILKGLHTTSMCDVWFTTEWSSLIQNTENKRASVNNIFILFIFSRDWWQCLNREWCTVAALLYLAANLKYNCALITLSKISRKERISEGEEEV